MSMVLCAGLWPFNFFALNHVTLSNDGLSFTGRGIVYARDILRTENDRAQRGELTLTIVIHPERSFSHYVPVIVAIDDGKPLERIIIGQWKSSLIVRSRSDEKYNRKGYIEIGLQDALPSKKEQFITITSSRKGASIYLNGELQKQFAEAGLLSPDELITGSLVIGNSPAGDRPWVGSINLLTLCGIRLDSTEVKDQYDSWIKGRLASTKSTSTALTSYQFYSTPGTAKYGHLRSIGDLIINKQFRPLYRRFLTMPWDDFRLNFSYLSDILINIAGLIPLGLFFSWYLSEHGVSRFLTAIIVIILGCSISLGIEFLQIYLPSRTSQFMDVISNTAGTALGIYLWHRFVFRFRMKAT